MAFFSTALALGVKVLGQNDTFVFWWFLQQMVFASQKVLWSVPQTVPCIGLTISCGFVFFWQMALASEKVLWRVPQTILESLHLSPKWLLLHKSSLERSANCALHLSPSLLLGSKLRPLLTCLCLTHTNPVRRKPSCRCCWSILWAYFFLRVGYLPYSVIRFEFEACFCFFYLHNFKKMRTFTTWAVGTRSPCPLMGWPFRPSSVTVRKT